MVDKDSVLSECGQGGLTKGIVKAVYWIKTCIISPYGVFERLKFGFGVSFGIRMYLFWGSFGPHKVSLK